MNTRRLRGICADLAAALPSGVGVESLRTHLETVRERPIRLVPVDGVAAPGVCGMWVEADAADFVFYRTDTSLTHRSHIILHELSHVILEHRGALAPECGPWLLPNLHEAAIRHILSRSTYTLREEQEAERLASMLAEPMLFDAGPAETGSGAARGDIAARLEDLLR